MSNGLEGVVAAETTLSHQDPATGMAWVRGHAVPDLVANFGYDGTVALLWQDLAGADLTPDAIRAQLGAARVAAFDRLDTWLDEAASRPLFEGMRHGIAMVPDDAGPADLVGAITVLVPALLRVGAGSFALPPDPSLSTPADLLRMLHGRAPDPTAVAALDVYFTAMMESGLNVSSFTARIVASTRASLACAIEAAWCAFTGPLHGGAPGPTLDLLDAAEQQTDLEGWLEARLRAGERLMGFGHRVYRGNDPRAEAMRRALSEMGPLAPRLAFARRLEQAVATAMDRVKPGRTLPPNVEIMAALLLDAVGFPREAFTPVFAVGRCAGWVAHALEQQKTGRMIRPTSKYIGPAFKA
jgi:citrate synthase